MTGWLTPMALFLLLTAAPALAADAGQIKVSKGAVHIERAGQRLPAPVGTRVQESDVVVTGASGSVGIIFADESLLSAGPNSVLAIERFAFDSTTHDGAFETRLQKGTLSTVSGKIAKRSAGAMRVRTPSALLGVRGTELVIRVTEAAQ